MYAILRNLYIFVTSRLNLLENIKQINFFVICYVCNYNLIIAVNKQYTEKGFNYSILFQPKKTIRSTEK